MSTTKPQLANRAKLIAELRSGKHTKQIGNIGEWQRPNAPVCFAGVAFRVVDGKPQSWFETEWWINTFGIDKDDLFFLVRHNDNPMRTFSDLADWLELLPARLPI